VKSLALYGLHKQRAEMRELGNFYRVCTVVWKENKDRCSKLDKKIIWDDACLPRCNAVSLSM